MKYVIGRAINGITINGREFICDVNNEVLQFNTEVDALNFLRDNGVDNLESEGIEILEDE